MAKAWVHAESSAKRWGGTPDDYIAIHEKMDQTKMAHAEVTHRCVFHSAFGIFLIEDIFGRKAAYAGRDASASPAVGSLALHKLELAAFLKQAFTI